MQIQITLNFKNMKVWEKNEYGLQNNYDEEGGLEGYLADHRIDY